MVGGDLNGTFILVRCRQARPDAVFIAWHVALV